MKIFECREYFDIKIGVMSIFTSAIEIKMKRGKLLPYVKKKFISRIFLFIKRVTIILNRGNTNLFKCILCSGDVLYIHSLNHFGGNKNEICEGWYTIYQRIPGGIVILDMPMLDISQYKDSMGQFTAGFVLQTSF